MMAPAMAAPAPADAIYQILSQCPGLFIRQKVQWLEEFTGCEQRNKYRCYIKATGEDQVGRDKEIKKRPVILTLKEESECCMRYCCGPYREFTVNVLDSADRKILHFHRPFRCTCWCGPFVCNPQMIEVSLPTGQALGKVSQISGWGQCSMWLGVFDDKGTKLYDIRMGCCQFGPNCCCKVWEAAIVKGDQVVGTIKNVFPGCNLRILTKADNLEISWDQPVEPAHKALLLGAVILIDFLYFEKSDDNNNDNALAALS